jgi:hypothetical protein
MSRPCTVPSGETISKGDAVCVVDFDTTNKRPVVERATRNNLSKSKTVFGVAEDDAVVAQDDTVPGYVVVLAAGEVADDTVTALGPGESRIIVPDLLGKLSRIDDTKGGTVAPQKEVYIVGTCDAHGHLVIQPRHSSDETGFPPVFNVRAYGAVPDDPVAAKKNSDAFQAALDAMRANSNAGAKLVAEGTFYLSRTLEITQSIIFEGIGQNDQDSSGGARSRPGTMLVFPGNVTGIRIRGGSPLDNPTKVYRIPPSGEKTILRNLTVSGNSETPPGAKECQDENEEDWCRPEGECIHGLHASAPVRLDNVTIQSFAHDGIHVVGAVCGKPKFEKHGVPIVDCDPKIDPDCKPVLDDRGMQVRVYDGNADGTYIENCSVGSCGRDGFHFQGGDAQACVIIGCSSVLNGRVGFSDETFSNTYIGCHSAYNTGPNYMTKGEYNASVFINCWDETGGPPNDFKGQVTIVSGKIGGHYMTPDSSAFILEHGVATRAPLVYKNLAGKTSIGVSLGDMTQVTQGPGDRMIAFQWATLNKDNGNREDFTSLRYLDPDKDSPENRGIGWWALAHNDDYYRHMIRFPTDRTNPRLFAPWFVNGIYLGSDNVGPPKVNFSAGRQTGVTYERGDVIWNKEPLEGEPLGEVCLDSATQTFAPFGIVDGPSRSYGGDHLLLRADRYITVTATTTVTLPGNPVDGQTHDIKSASGVTTTVDTQDAALKIDGRDSVTVESGKNTTFRYSIATAEWETR